VKTEPQARDAADHGLLDAVATLIDEFAELPVMAVIRAVTAAQVELLGPGHAVAGPEDVTARARLKLAAPGA
jgi:hypothetical protein